MGRLLWLPLAISPARLPSASLVYAGVGRSASFRAGAAAQAFRHRVDLHPDAALPFVEFKRAGLAGDP